MTKTSIFGQSELKQIEFVKWFNGDKTSSRDLLDPKEFKSIVLLATEYSDDGLDLMWAHNDNPNNGDLYLGHWNDGVV